LLKRAGEFSVLLSVHCDLFENEEAAKTLEVIPEKIALSAFNNATVKASTVALGVNHWSEVQGTMVNCNGMLQKLSAAPVSPDTELRPAFSVLAELAETPLSCACEAFALAKKMANVLSAYSYETIRSTGVMLDGVQL
ncbi:MAG: proton-conducting membrane transporter, partial [Fibrobacteraceae bacterium]|nr:proton-conducting membrane transporter [Fibrobacteraceae bacterium]